MVRRNLIHLLPWRLIKTYVYPRILRGEKFPYQGDRFFESYYRSLLSREFSDRITIAPDVHPLHARVHYNATEISIIRCLLRHPVRDAPIVLDIGSGAGHWIDFWLATLNASFVQGIDISSTCAEALRTKYAQRDDVAISQGDISRADFAAERRFDVISAIGVLFHVVDDADWRRALVNLRELLSEGGLIVVGGHFGWTTQNTQFHVTDDFANEQEAMASLQNVYGAGKIRYNKRVRSLRYWKAAAAEAGLQIVEVVRTPTYSGIGTPENNIVALKRVDRGSG